MTLQETINLFQSETGKTVSDSFQDFWFWLDSHLENGTGPFASSGDKQ